MSPGRFFGIAATLGKIFPAIFSTFRCIAVRYFLTADFEFIQAGF
jgi:hypothetical protein